METKIKEIKSDMNNKPPYTITKKAADYSPKIVEIATQLEFETEFKRDIRLHRENRLRTIHSSLAIAENTLTLGEVPAIIEGKVVAGKQTEMSTRESNVKRAIILSALCFMFLFLTINKSAFGGTMPELTIAEQMLYSTVKITTFRGDNSYEGTGFFMDFAVADSGYIPTIITNKHVVQIEDRINIVFHIEEQGRPSGEEFLTCTLDITQNNYFEHPDPMVDLCAITIGSIIAQAKNSGKPVFIRSLGLEFIPKKEDWQSFDAIEDVTMVGYPRGISDNVNNLPVVRRGITATSLGMPYNGKQEFMIDMACFPGSSGSPVFLYNKGIVVDRRNDRPIMGNRFYLVGILYAGPLVTNTGQLILAQPPEVSVQTMMHLGNVIKSTQLSGLDAVIRSRHPAIQKPD